MNQDLIINTSTFADGNMSLNWGEKLEVEKNRKRFLGKSGIKIEDCVYASLLGGTKINTVGREDKGKFIEGDALITTQKGVALFMVTGDCLPVAFFDPTKKILAMAHLGWKGVDLRLAEKVMKRLKEVGANTEQVRVFIGPGVRKDTYIKYGEKLEFFKKNTGKAWKDFLVNMPDKKVGLDLVGYVIRQLVGAGVKEKNINVSDIDTIADKNYFSHYRAGMTGEKEGRFATVLMRK